jgi:hypothetical protein
MFKAKSLITPYAGRRGGDSCMATVSISLAAGVVFGAVMVIASLVSNRGSELRGKTAVRTATKTQLKDDNLTLTNFGTTYPYLYDPGSIYRDTI